jgi:hypothetical protein
MDSMESITSLYFEDAEDPCEGCPYGHTAEPDLMTYKQFLKVSLEIIDSHIEMLKRYKETGETEKYLDRIDFLKSHLDGAEFTIHKAIAEKEGSVFYVDDKGLPTVHWVGPVKKAKIMERQMELRGLYV